MEVTHIQGVAANAEIINVQLTPTGSRGFNPAFDVTPARLVTALITEKELRLQAKQDCKSYIIQPNLISCIWISYLIGYMFSVYCILNAWRQIFGITA